MEHVPFEASLRLYNRANWDTQKSTLHYPLCPASQSMRHLKVHHSQRQTNRSRSTRQAMVHQKAKYNDKSLTFHSNALLSSSSENPRLLEEAHHSRLPNGVHDLLSHGFSAAGEPQSLRISVLLRHLLQPEDQRGSEPHLSVAPPMSRDSARALATPSMQSLSNTHTKRNGTLTRRQI